MQSAPASHIGVLRTRDSTRDPFAPTEPRVANATLLTGAKNPRDAEPEQEFVSQLRMRGGGGGGGGGGVCSRPLLAILVC